MAEVKFLRKNNVALSNHKYVNTGIRTTDVDGHLDPDLE